MIIDALKELLKKMHAWISSGIDTGFTVQSTKSPRRKTLEVHKSQYTAFSIGVFGLAYTARPKDSMGSCGCNCHRTYDNCQLNRG